MSLNPLRQLEECYHLVHPAVENTKEAFAFFTGIPDPYLNPVMHLRYDGDVAAKVDALLSYLPKETPVSFWLHPQNRGEGLLPALKERGFEPLFTCPLMGWDVKDVTKTDHLIEQGDMGVFHDILAKGFQFNETVKKGYIELFSHAPAENYQLYLDNEPVSIGSLCPVGKNGCIFNITTLFEHQKKGCFKAIMLHLMHRAHALGLERLVLLGAPGSENIYGDLGFTKFFDIEIYKRD